MAPADNSLRWRCRRGTREMDLLLLRFLERDYPHLNARQQSLFGALLDEADPDLYAWITGRENPVNPDYLPIIGKISNNGDNGTVSTLPEEGGRHEPGRTRGGRQ